LRKWLQASLLILVIILPLTIPMTIMQPASASPLNIDHEKYRDYAERMADAWLQNCRFGSTYLYHMDWDTNDNRYLSNQIYGMGYDHFFLRALYLLYLTTGDEGYKRRIRAYFEDMDTYLRLSNNLFGGGDGCDPTDPTDPNKDISHPNLGEIMYLDYIYAATWYDDAITKWLDAIIEYHIPAYDDLIAVYRNWYEDASTYSSETSLGKQLGVALYFISGYAATGNYTYLRFAKRLVNGVWQSRNKTTNLIPSWFTTNLDFSPKGDYALPGSEVMILASILLYETTGDEDYLDRAESCASAMLTYSYHTTGHYLYAQVKVDGTDQTGEAGKTLTALFAKRLVSLYKITDNSTYLTRAEEIESYLASFSTSDLTADDILAYMWLLLDLYRATDDDTYLIEARDLADWVIDNLYYNGFINEQPTVYEAYMYDQGGFITAFLSLASPVALSTYPEVAAGVSFTNRLTEYPYVFQSPPLLYVNKTYIDGLDYDTEHHTIRVSVASDEKNTTKVTKVDVMVLTGTLSVKNVLVEDVYYPSDMWERVDIEGSRFYTAHNVTLHTSSMLHIDTVEFVYKGYDLKITMLDSKDRPLPDAFVILYIGDTASINGTAGSDGYKKFYDLKETEYTLKVYWKDVFVGAKNVSLTEDMSVTVSCAVYDLTIKITYPPWDTPLSNVTVSIQMGNTTFSSLITGSNGSGTSTLPQGNYTVALYWLTYNLENRTVNVNSNKEVKFSVNIYYWYLLVVGKMFYQIAFGNPPMTVTTIVVFFLIIFLLFFRYWRLLLRRERFRRLFPEVMGPPP